MEESAMADTNPADQSRLGNDYREGPNPNPGGDIDLSDRTVPPYEGRTESADVADADESTSGGASTGGATGPVEDAELKAQPADETPGGATASPADEQPASEQPEGEPSDPGVGPAHSAGTRRGEDFLSDEGTEAGREHTGTDESTAQRPTGESDERDRTSMEPQEGTTDRTSG
jgi:hypothetical protein